MIAIDEMVNLSGDCYIPISWQEGLSFHESCGGGCGDAVVLSFFFSTGWRICRSITHWVIVFVGVVIFIVSVVLFLAWYTICLLRNSAITDNIPQLIYLPLCHKPFVIINTDSSVLHYTWHLLHYCQSWERDPSHVALTEVSTFSPVKFLFFFLTLVKGRGYHTLSKPYGTTCDLWTWALQIKSDWLIDWPHK